MPRSDRSHCDDVNADLSPGTRGVPADQCDVVTIRQFQETLVKAGKKSMSTGGGSRDRNEGKPGSRPMAARSLKPAASDLCPTEWGESKRRSKWIPSIRRSVVRHHLRPGGDPMTAASSPIPRTNPTGRFWARFRIRAINSCSDLNFIKFEASGEAAMRFAFRRTGRSSLTPKL